MVRIDYQFALEQWWNRTSRSAQLSVQIVRWLACHART